MLGESALLSDTPKFFRPIFLGGNTGQKPILSWFPMENNPSPLLLHLPVREVANISQPKTHVWENHPIVTYLITVTGRLHKSQAGCFTPTSRQWGNPCPPLRVH